jgi:hypothetical protein
MTPKMRKEWNVPIWVICCDGKPFDYALSRAQAYKVANLHRDKWSEHFWAVMPHKATLSLNRKGAA